MSMVSESEMDDTQEPFAPYTVLQRTAACIGGILVFFFFLFFLLISSQALSSRASYGPRALSLSLISLPPLLGSVGLFLAYRPMGGFQVVARKKRRERRRERRRRSRGRTRGSLRRRNYPVRKRDMRIVVDRWSDWQSGQREGLDCI